MSTPFWGNPIGASAEAVQRAADVASKHTPGPWKYTAKLTPSENHRGFFISDGKWGLAEVQPGDEDGVLGLANARLIAAAPDLLQAAKDARVLLANMGCPLDWLDAAIAKALGGSTQLIGSDEGKQP